MSLVYKYGIVEEEEADAINLPNGAESCRLGFLGALDLS